MSTKPEDMAAYFADMADRPDEEINLAEASFWLECYANPDLDVPACMTALDALAERIAPTINAVQDEQGRVYKLCFVFFQDLGFRGNQANFYDSHNSYLRAVMERRMGIPISLSVLLLELAWRLNLPLKGVGFPGHFLVRYDGQDSAFYIDSFHGGRFMSEVDCADMLETMGGGEVVFDTELLRPVSKRAILLRLMRNLKGIHLRSGDNEPALHIVGVMLSLDPEDWNSVRDRGIIYANTGALRQANDDFKAFLEARPDAPEAMFIRSKLHEVRDKLFSVQ